MSDLSDNLSTSSITSRLSSTSANSLTTQKSQKDSNYTAHKRKANDTHSVWFHFLIFNGECEDKKETAKCKICSSILKIKGGSTKGLIVHLLKVHKIDIKEKRQDRSEENNTIFDQNTASTSSSNRNESMPLHKQRKLTEFYVGKKEQTLDAVLARMISLDGLPFSIFVTSMDLRESLKSRGFILPTSVNTIKKKVLDYAKKIRSQVVQEILRKQKEGTKFSLTFDEWTSISNKRFMNVNVHDSKEFWNIGLIRIRKSFTAEVCVEYLEKRLNEYGLKLSNDIVSITTDGASVMKKVGSLISPDQQLCLAHGLQLAIVDVLYKKPHENENIDNLGFLEGSAEDSDSDPDEEELEEGSTDIANVNIMFQQLGKSRVVKMTDTCNIQSMISKTRKLVKIFRKSPLKNEILQNYVNQDHGKELKLILDCQTRWSSLFIMLQRFILLENCIRKSMVDLKIPFLTDNEFAVIKQLAQILEPVKLTVEALCRRDMNLYKADIAMQFMMEEIKKNTSPHSPLGKALIDSLTVRIQERRTLFSGILSYLEDPINLRTGSSPLLGKPVKKVLVQEIEKLILRLVTNEGNGNGFENDNDKDDNVTIAEIQRQQSRLENQSFKEKLQSALNQVESERLKKPASIKKLSDIISQEIDLLNDGGSLGINLQLASDYLKTIPPTSVESERCFSSAGLICSKIRSKLEDNTIDDLMFLRHYFRK